MRPAAFHISRPASVAEALNLLAATPRAAVLAGGQALLRQLRDRRIAPPMLIDLACVAELAFVHALPGALEIGAMTTLATLAGSPAVADGCPALRDAISRVGDVQIRSRATLGGNVLSGWSSDLAVVLSAYGAEAELICPAGLRRVAVADLAATGCGAGEILRALTIPATPAGAFEKLSRRSADSAIVSAACAIFATGNGPRHGIALGGVHAHASVVPAVAAMLDRGERSRAVLRGAFAVAVQSGAPPDTPHASAAYRRRVAPEIALRAVDSARRAAGLEVLA